ncbi:PEP-CTERM sorting domain-containing protein [Coraliomargarita sp. SDUM461003]|uniref:PEP-CTERM sorting domain-containing protein n=1 Tax=Thalassobacterium maritimum TaxID=3041265 RepID=A0ABU1AX33_9BACT|nr:PEP-CTERM sorting domain-containing protein [Coraliomargarita sp. SDUM461003]MDQ8208641.1 PEP-CTERM sorting domain-containing protein [Coraliomargarita sp. SDUM461003]
MKIKTISALVSLLLVSYASATITFNGTSLSNAPSLVAGQVGVYLVSTDGTPFTSGALSSLSAGASLTDSSTYGSSFEYIGHNTVTSFGSVFLSSGFDFSHGNGIDQNDAFGVLVFETSTANTLSGDSYQIWTDGSWLVPADLGGAFTFASEFPQLTTASNASGTVVPEPSAFAAMAGLMALGFVMVRRRG